MAIAPEHTGIGIRRHFTTEGVHPYDEVEWDVRDARITNYRDGTVAFEQLGVEVPASWSQNATNILAQKYFRGSLGSPTRERSLRQVIDRVVNTVADWGITDGYFADDAEADAFRDELTHVILHQKAAFNSPVWFNIGVKGEPQQASACQPYDALVSTPEGLVPIGRLVEDDAVGTKVLDAHGVTKVVAVKANGRKPVLRIHTKAGYALDVTDDHLVWRASGISTGAFVPAGELRVGDQLEWHRAESFGTGEITSREVAEAALAGWLQGDGFVGRCSTGTNRSPTVEAMTVTPAEHQWVRDAIDVVLPGVHLNERSVETQSPDLDCRRHRLYGAPLEDFVSRWGLMARGTDMVVPEHLFTAPLPVAAAYLRSLFQAEGYVSIRPRAAVVGLAMISTELVRGLQQLLLRFGIYSRTRFANDARADRKGCTVLSIRTAGDRRRFADEIGFVDPTKAEKLEASLEKPGLAARATKRLEIDRIEPIGSMEVYDIQTESGEYLSGSLRVHNCFILSVDDTMRSILNWYVEEGTIFKGGSGAGINLSAIRSSAEELKGGGTASGPVSFMRGADASAGTIKCIHADTPITTDHGVVAIKDAHPGWKVLTREDFRTIEAVHDNGRRPLVRVTTELGDEILCTSEHRFLVSSRKAGIQFRQAGELLADDYLMLDLSAPFAGEPQTMKTPERRPTRELRHDLPSTLDEPFALWLGWVYGDGSITERPSTKFVAVQIGDKDEGLVERYESLVKGVFGDKVHLVKDRHLDRPDASVSVRFCSSQVIRFLDLNGLRKQKAANLRVPVAIQSSPAAVRASFLSGLFEADGHVANGYPSLSTISRDFALDVHRLLLSIGIPSKVGRIDDRRTAHGKNPVHTVRIVGGEGVRRFTKLVGFVSERKHRALELALLRKDAGRFETQWHMPHVGPEFNAIWEESDGALKRALAPYCRYETPRRLSLLRARALLDDFYNDLHGAPFAEFAEGRHIYVRATVEPAGEGPVFDLTVEGVHEYQINSITTHNSGGKTRRAAKMVILNADHPDVEDFIWCKAVEERKARVLRDAGFDMDLDGKDSHSTQYQNANNSVRVTDEFMQAVVDDADWHFRAVKDGRVLRTIKARDLFRQIAEAAWECADPGMQFDTTINRWHTASNTGPINASNPCFTGDSLVHTDKGLIRFDQLLDRARLGETFGVYTHDATNVDAPADRLEITTPDAFMITGWNEIVRLRFDNGMTLRCTSGHKVFTVNRGYVPAGELTPQDRVKVLDLPAPATRADQRLPVSCDVRDYATKGDWSRSLHLPEKWSPEFGHYLGWLVGDGCVSGDVVTTVYGGDDDQTDVLPRHLDLLAGINGDRSPKPSVQANGTVQLRQSRRVIARFLEELGVSGARAAAKTVPWAVEQAPADALAAFLQGLFDADGCVYDGAKSRYVGLGSASVELLRGVQRLLSSLGVLSRIYKTKEGAPDAFSYETKAGLSRSYASQAMFDLRVSGSSLQVFSDTVGFSIGSKSRKLTQMLQEHKLYRTKTTASLVERTDDGVELTYNLSEPRNHSYMVNGLVVRNCSEYMHLDNSACNLASLNLLKFLGDDGSFDVEGFRVAARVVFTAQEILVGNADYPTESIAETSRRFRQLGLGYANLGAMLMALGLAYDSDEGRAWAAAITALMTGEAYATSALTAMRMGPFAGYTENREPMNRVLGMHRDALEAVDKSLAPAPVLTAAYEAWDGAIEVAQVHGVRNSQATVLAPTGTIGLLMDCDTTGIEPDLGLCKTKKLVGGGTMSIVNQTVPRALKRMGYSPDQVQDVLAYIDEHKSILGAPHVSAEHINVFSCSMGDNVIHYLGHVKMMSAVQPWISGAISKTVNMPEEVTVEEVEQLHIDAWRLGIKALAIYRDNCKVAQPLSATKSDKTIAAEAADAASVLAGVEASLAGLQPVREKLPRVRASKTFSFRVADCHGYVTVGEYDDGRPGEIFLRVAKQGSTLAGIMDAFAISVSHGLQYGVPLKAFVEMYTSMRFEPAGMTDDPDIRFASSLVDYIFRRLAVAYLPADERAELGILTVDERMQPTLPGVEEQATPSSLGSEMVADPAPRPVSTAPKVAPPVTAGPPPAGPTPTPKTAASDAPYCYQCGMVMQRAGACFVCGSCGTTSGCS